MNNINNDENESPTLRKVTIMTTGSRGDIQPFVAIGIALKRKGYTVRIMTQPSETHQKLCHDFGLEHVPFGIDADAFMRDDPACRASIEEGNVLKFFGCLGNLVKNNTKSNCDPFVDEIVSNKTGNRPDFLIVSFLNRFFGLYAKYVLGIPTIEVGLQHWVFDNPSRAPMGMPTLPMGLHTLIQTKLMIPQDYTNFTAFDQCIAESIISSTKATSKQQQQTLLRLEDFLQYEQFYDSEVNHAPLLPRLIAQSTHFQEILCPRLSLKNFKYVGPPVIDPADQVTNVDNKSFGGDASRQCLEEFLQKDPSRKPIYLGWGSMLRRSTHEMVLFAVQVLFNSNQRGIVLGGLAGLSMKLLKEAVVTSKCNDNNDVNGDKLLEYAIENILFVDKVPHEWLFPQVSLTIHHGGAGTTNAALRSGIPTIVTPVFGDQYDNSYVVQKLGVGIGFDTKLQDIDADDLSKTITAVLNNPTIANTAQKIGKELRANESNSGSNAVLEEIETYWNKTVASGKFKTQVEEWKAATKVIKYSNEKKKVLRNRVFAVLAFSVAVPIITYFVN